MKRLIFYVIVLVMFTVSGTNAATLKWDASDEGMDTVMYRVYGGKTLETTEPVDETGDLAWRIPDTVPFNTIYQVTAFNTNGESPMSNHVVYTNKQIPITPGGVDIIEDDTLGYKGPYKYHKDGGLERTARLDW